MSDVLPVPEGFTPLEVKSDYVNHLGQFYEARREGRRIFGIRVEQRHMNSAGKTHGGFLLSAADFALSWGTFAAGDVPPRATLSLTMDFARPARLGDWLELDVRLLRAGQSVAFLHCDLTVDGKAVGHASGVFRLVPTTGAIAEGSDIS